MTELFFLRHGQRIDHALQEDPSAEPLYPDYKPYDPSLSKLGETQIINACDQMVNLTTAFTSTEPLKKNIFIHFSPYLRCCQTADLIITHLKQKLEAKHPNYKLRFQLLGDFALSEWIHDRMTNKPPFYDSNDAYQMYTPNIKLLKNRSACSNFRPTNTLGHYNGYDLSYKDYQNNCKEYFKKLLATYDKPTYIKNQDIIIVVSHGYFINNLLSYFVTHPIFDEIPEGEINMARREHVEETNTSVSRETQKTHLRDLGEVDKPEDAPKSRWVLVRDALDLFNYDLDKSLNLETDIVYYKTNFIKRNEIKKDNPIQTEDIPRPSFKINQTSESYTEKSSIFNNPICPAAKDWTPSMRKFKIRNDFKLKTINTEAFKPDFDITKPPSRPLSPPVSPNSEPTRNNSVIDLSKLNSSDENYKPMRLRYSTTDSIPIEQLNQKVNSQVNLAQHQRSYPSSANSSITDFPKFITKRAISKDSYFSPKLSSSPRFTGDKLDNSSFESLDHMEDEDLGIIEEARDTRETGTDKDTGNMVPHNLLNRSKSLKYREELALNSGRSLLALYQKQQEDEDDKFSLSFGNRMPVLKSSNSIKKVRPGPTTLGSVQAGSVGSTMESAPNSNVSVPTRQRKNSIKFIPTIDRASNATPVGMYKKPLMFYNLDSDSDSGLEVDVLEGEEKFMWFGQNK